MQKYHFVEYDGHTEDPLVPTQHLKTAKTCKCIPKLPFADVTHKHRQEAGEVANERKAEWLEASMFAHVFTHHSC